MDVTGIGVQTITPTTGTVVQNSPPVDRDSDQRAAPPPPPPPAPGTGVIVDKSA